LSISRGFSKTSVSKKSSGVKQKQATRDIEKSTLGMYNTCKFIKKDKRI
jgi:hypothetical protein